VGIDLIVQARRAASPARRRPIPHGCAP
jgi:hypothetical protein